MCAKGKYKERKGKKREKEGAKRESIKEQSYDRRTRETGKREN